MSSLSEYKLSLMLPLFVALAFMLLFFGGPIEYSFNIKALFLIILFYFSYITGWFYYSFLPKKNIRRTIPSFGQQAELPRILSITTVLFFFTGMYFALIWYDFFVIGDILNTGITGNRQSRILDGPRGSLIGFFIVLFTGAPLLLLISLLAYTEIQKNKNLYFYKIQLFISIFGLLSYFLSGGRNNFAISIVIIILVLFLLKKIKKTTHSKKKYLFKGVLLFFLLFSFLFMLYIFIERANLQGITIYSYVLRMESEFAINVMHVNFQSSLIREFYYAFIVFLFYLNHPIMLISEYFDVSFSGITYGALSFPLPTMLYDLFFGTQVFSDALDSLILKGVYLSMPGFLFIDFGYLGVVLCGFLLGFLVPFLLKKFQVLYGNNSYYYLVLASVLLCTVVLAPMYNILSSFGFSILLMLLIVYICVFSYRLLLKFF